MPAGADFRAIADALGVAGREIAEDTTKTATERATLLHDVALSGKAAMDASAAAAAGPNDVELALANLADDLAEAGYLEDAQTLSITDLLRVFLRAAIDLKKQPGHKRALERAYRIAAGRLLWVTEAQESTQSDVAMRVARANRQAITESVMALEQAGLSIPVEPRGAA